MKRRMMLAVFVLLWVVTSAWPKLRPDEQQYWDDHFKALQQELEELTTQMKNLQGQLQVLRESQAQYQEVIARQQNSLKSLDEMVTSMRLGSEENFSNLKTVILQLRKATQDGFVKLCGSAPPTGVGGAVTSIPVAPPATVVQGYVTAVEGNNVQLDIGSDQGLRQGSRLALYKSSDPNTQVGILEVTQVIDTGKSRAQVTSLNPGVRPDWGDLVRVQ